MFMADEADYGESSTWLDPGGHGDSVSGSSQGQVASLSNRDFIWPVGILSGHTRQRGQATQTAPNTALFRSASAVVKNLDSGPKTCCHLISD